MSLFYIRFVFLLLISTNYIFGSPPTKLPLCQCECCPGEQCQSQLLVFSVDQCNETTCSFGQCYKIYPRKCGLIPGTTETLCNVVKHTTITSSNVTKPSLSHARSSSNVILPFMSMMNIFFYFLSKLF